MLINRDIIVIGTSAGGIEALTQLFQELPQDLPAAVFVVCHISPESPGVLPRIISRHSQLPAVNAFDNDPIEPGRVYVAPPDHHLLLEEGFVRVTQGPKENRFRPAVDPLFRSAAYIYGPRVIGVVLTGNLDDGTAGLWAIKERGGLAVVQDPSDALFPSMPLSALTHVVVDHRIPLSELAVLLVRLTAEQVKVEGGYPMPDKMGIEVKIAKEDRVDPLEVEKLGETSAFACPECHGVLWKMGEGGIMRFRCRTGHAYSAQSLLVELSETSEAMLWSAIRGLEENADLARRLAEHLHQEGKDEAAAEFMVQAQLTEERANLVRQVLPRQLDPGQLPQAG
jgi:two-component system chemotaxis response regulator CheB